MYSFYRAWLMRDAVSATLSTPPDLLITVGGPHLSTKYHQFAAHRHVVSAHSGYLKALLASAPGQGVAVPNVGPDAFGPLLTYMYTGYLDVNLDNIYSILLATHLLHMPRALDHCRAFLIQNQQPALHPRLDGELAGGFLAPHSLGDMPDKHREDLPTLVKPIPSRKMLPVLFNLNSNLPAPIAPVNSNFWPHLSYPLPPTMMSNNHSPFKTVLPTPIPEIHDPGLQYPPSVGKLRESYPHHEERTKTPSRKRPRSPLAIPSTSTSRRNVLLRVTSPVRSSSVSPCPTNSSLDSDELNVNLSSEETQDQSKTDKHKQSRPKKNEHSVEAMCSTGDKGKVIIDVACCDGPVRFHRVLNDNYGFQVDEIVVENDTQENVGITSMRKELALRRSAQTNNHLIPKKIVKLSPNTASTRAEKVDEGVAGCVQQAMSVGVGSSSETTLQSGREIIVDVPGRSDCLTTPCTEPVSEVITTSETESAQNKPLHCTNNQPGLDRSETPVSYQQLGGFINAEAENNIVQSEAYVSNIHHSGSSSNQSGNSQSNIHQLGEASNYSTQATTSAHLDFQSDSAKAPNQSSSTSSAGKASTDNIYTCVYCNHTFKSHYCYQKHARRHINPVTLDMSSLVDRLASKAPCNQASKVPDKTAGVRREVRLLDMNVQYYPCKTCGSKFPSYYFVHKHRKMCHADEADEITASEESQTHSQSTTINSI